MKCPNDETVLVMSDRQGVEIDYCPQCRGVWLDRGELDKILERTPAIGSNNSSGANYGQVQPRAAQNSQPEPNEYHHGSNDHRYKKHKKESFLGDLFDF